MPAFSGTLDVRPGRRHAISVEVVEVQLQHSSKFTIVNQAGCSCGYMAKEMQAASPDSEAVGAPAGHHHMQKLARTGSWRRHGRHTYYQHVLSPTRTCRLDRPARV